FRAVSFKVSLSSALIATVALLIIVVVAVVVVGVVVIVGIYRLASTVTGRMANPFAIIAPRPGQCSASYSAMAGSDCFQKLHFLEPLITVVVVAVGAGVTGGTSVDLVVLFDAIFLKSQENNIREISYNHNTREPYGAVWFSRERLVSFHCKDSPQKGAFGLRSPPKGNV
nr:hypothetical protein [Tanacetum cinerariifolium]